MNDRSASVDEANGALPGFLDHITKILEIDSNKDIRSFLRLFLKRSRTLLSVDYLCVYHIKSHRIDLTKLAAIGQQERFPGILPLEELSCPYQPDFWYEGQEGDTEIKRFAVREGLKFLVTHPLGKGQEFIGIIVAGARHPNQDEFITAKMQVISGVIESVLQKQILRDALQNRIEKQSRVFHARNIFFDNTKEGMILINPGYKVIEINAAAEQMLGYSQKEVVRQHITDVLVGADGLINALEVASAGIDTRELGVVSLHRRNGQAFSVHIQTLPLLDREENLQGIAILISDESENEQNRIRVQHLEQRAALGGLSAIFAHEVRNPLNNLSTAVQLLKSRMISEDPNYEVLMRMQNDCNRLITLMESVLAFSRPVEPKLQSVNINSFLTLLLERWRPRLDRLNIPFILQKPTKDLFARGDMRLLDQVFTNLISNAVEVMERTSGTLAIKISRNELVLAQPQIEIAVSDTGPGIPDDIIDKIFDPFVTTKPKGTGLGLAITKHLVTAQQGTIRVDSFPGGSVFYVNLPEYQEKES